MLNKINRSYLFNYNFPVISQKSEMAINCKVLYLNY